MVLSKQIEHMCRVGDMPTDNKIIHALKRQSMKKSKMRCVYKRDSIMFFLPGEKGKELKRINNIKG